MSDDEEDGIVRPTNRVNQKSKCKKLFCDKCAKIDTTGEITCNVTGKKFVTKTNVTCESSNVIYCLECKRCNLQYVGKTENPIKERLGSHLSAIKRNVGETDVPWHFNQKGHEKMSDVKLYIVEFVGRHPKSDEGRRLLGLVEFFWIEKLHTHTPHGMNTKDGKYG